MIINLKNKMSDCILMMRKEDNMSFRYISTPLKDTGIKGEICKIFTVLNHKTTLI